MSRYVFKTKPRPYQVAALKFLLRNEGGGLQVPKRWGKSWLAINFASALAVKWNEDLNVLITCPSTVLSVWPDQIAEHCPIEWTCDDGQKVTHAGLGPVAVNFRVVNFESTYSRVSMDPHNVRSKTPMPREDLDGWADVVIVDESHAIGNPTAVTSIMVYRYGKSARARLIMSGSTFMRRPVFVFGQFKFLDDSLLGTNFGQFKKRIEVRGGYMNYEVKGYRNLEWVMGRILPCIWVQERPPLEQPPVHQVYRYDLPAKERKLYDQMEKEDAVQLEDGEILGSPIVLTKHLRLQQIVGGWLRKESGKYVRVGTAHRDFFGQHLVQNYAEQDIKKIVVGCRFVPEILDAADMAKKAGYRVVVLHGGIPKGDARKRRIQAFQDTDKPTVFIAQVATAKEGIDLSAAANIIWYSLPESYVTFDQFSGRIELYDEKRTLGYDYLLANGTRSVVTYNALLHKQDVAEYMVKNPKKVEELTRLAALKR